MFSFVFDYVKKKSIDILFQNDGLVNINQILKILICCADHEPGSHRYCLHKWISCHVLSMSVIMMLLLSRYCLHSGYHSIVLPCTLTFRIPISPSQVSITSYTLYFSHIWLSLAVHLFWEFTIEQKVQNYCQFNLLFSHRTLSLLN